MHPVEYQHMQKVSMGCGQVEFDKRNDEHLFKIVEKVASGAKFKRRVELRTLDHLLTSINSRAASKTASVILRFAQNIDDHCKRTVFRGYN